MIVIIDYGMGNLRSILKKFERLEIEAKVSSKIEDIESASKLILPGVGHFAQGIKNIKELKFIDILNKKVIEEKTPILGICLGMQLFANFSEEGNVKGLGWIDADVKKFNLEDKKLCVPHVGWNNIEIKKKSLLFEKIDPNSRFYFTHSYYFNCHDKKDILTTTDYGFDFTSSVQKQNIIGTQFHPEKSHLIGLEIIKNFAQKI